MDTDKNDLAKDSLQALLLTLLIRLKQDGSAGGENYPTMKNDLVSKVNRALIDSKKTDLSVTHIAKRVGLSESRARSLFKNVSGVSLGQYVMNYKIHVSLSLLRDSNLSIAEVAGEAGFASLQAFSRAFKQQTGKPPRDFRKVI